MKNKMRFCVHPEMSLNICRTEKCFEHNLQKCPTNFPYFLPFSIKFNKGRKGAKAATQTSLMKNR